MKYSLPLLLLVITFGSCSQKDAKIIKYSQREPVYLSEGLLTHFPGTLCLCEDYIVWGSPFADDHFANIVERTTGKSLGAFGTVGNGPREFIFPEIACCKKNEILVFDMVSGKSALLSVPKYIKDEQYITQQDSGGKDHLVYSTRMILINDSSYVVLAPENLNILKYIHNGEVAHEFGPKPFGNKAFNNSWDVLQGNLAFCPKRKLLIYGASRIPYLAIFKLHEDTFHLTHEFHGDFKFDIRENEVIPDQTKSGVFDIVLTRDFIIARQRDYENDPTDESTVGRDFSKLPTTVFLYNYEAELEEIVDLGQKVLRIAAEPDSNTLFAIIVEDEFRIVKYELLKER
jgi:hypothetical protein